MSPRLIGSINPISSILFRSKLECSLGRKVRHYSHVVTTPLFYINAFPHIGHIYSFLLGDAVNRFARMKGNSDGSTMFLSGTDEHGTKVQNAALLSGQTCEGYCALQSDLFLDIFNGFENTLTRFNRTSNTIHKNVVSNIFVKHYRGDVIYDSKYSGWYSKVEESFVPVSQLQIKGKDGTRQYFGPAGDALEFIEEETSMFRYTNYKKEVESWLMSKRPIYPDHYNDEAINIARELEDISVSRSASKVFWGVPSPADANQTIYVWFDALLSYLEIVSSSSAVLYDKQIDCQIFGKDILKFHAVMWPAILLSMNKPLPAKLICHSHWQMNNSKMSKSKGNVVTPIKEVAKLTHEGLRYYLLRSATLHDDTNYDRASAISLVNGEIVNKLANLVSRSCSIAVNPNQIVTTKFAQASKPDIDLVVSKLKKLRSTCEEHYTNCNFYKGIDAIMDVLGDVNELVSVYKPWILVNNTDLKSRDRYNDIQTLTFECLRVCSILLQPIIPVTSSRILDKLSVFKTRRNLINANVSLINGNPEMNTRPLKRDSDVIFERLKN